MLAAGYRLCLSAVLDWTIITYSWAFRKHSSPAAGKEDDESSEREAEQKKRLCGPKPRDRGLRDDAILQLLKNMIRTAVKINS